MSSILTTRARAKPFVVKYSKTRLEVVEGPDVGLVLEIAWQPNHCGDGRTKRALFSTTTPCRVSTARSNLMQDGVRVRDRGSRNGVFTSTARIFDAVCVAPQVLVLGATKIAMTPLDETVERLQSPTDRSAISRASTMARARELFADLERVAPSEATLLIEGETGTGKDVVAESVHREAPEAKGLSWSSIAARSPPASPRQNCSATSATHSRGPEPHARGYSSRLEAAPCFSTRSVSCRKTCNPSFSGCSRSAKCVAWVRPGRSRSMSGSWPRRTLAKCSAGRLVSAGPLLSSGSGLCLPPTVARADVGFSSSRRALLGARVSARSLGGTTRSVAALAAHHWPGNVRELRNAVQRLLLTPGRPLGATFSAPQEADRAVVELRPLRLARREASDAFERSYMAALLTRNQWPCWRCGTRRRGLASDAQQADAQACPRLLEHGNRRRLGRIRRSHVILRGGPASRRALPSGARNKP